MIIGLHDSEKEHFKKAKTFPNYALMKISAYHKAKGDTVEWWDPVKTYDRVYSSKIFDFTEENRDLPPDTIKGGTGYDIESKLTQEIDDIYPDYSIYPDCDYAIGYITRGCPRNCPWCYVPQKEGNIKPYRLFIYVLVRKDLDEADYRVQRLKRHKGIHLYAQAERNEGLGIRPNKAQLEFTNRYIYGNLYRKETWKEYLDKRPWIMRRLEGV